MEMETKKTKQTGKKEVGGRDKEGRQYEAFS